MTRFTLVAVLALLVSSSLGADQPDLSTPERAFAGFALLWRSAAQDRARWERVAADAEAGTAALRTEGFAAKLAARAATARDMAANTAFVWGDFEVTPAVVEGDAAMVVVHLAMKIRTPTFGAGDGYTEKDHREPYRFNYRKIGDQWRLAEMWKVCPSCSGTAVCASCGGSGMGRAGSCAGCGGRKRCPRCDGKVFVQATLTHHLLVDPGTLFYDEQPFAPPTDVSTARAATQAYMASWIGRERIRGRAIVDRLGELMPRLAAFLTPANAEAAQLVLARELDTARSRLKGVVHAITELREHEAEAFAMTRATVDGVDYDAGLLLEKVGERWLVAGILTQKCIHCAGSSTCQQCKGTGQCQICGGTGKSGEYDCMLCGAKGQCFGCKGKRGCGQCRGFGWVSAE